MNVSSTPSVLPGLFGLPENTIDEEFLHIFRSIIGCGLILVIGISGSFGNILTAIVIFRLGLADAVNVVILSLAVCDLFFLLTLSLRKLYCVIAQFDLMISEIFQAYVLCYAWMPGRLALTLSVFHIVIIAVERFMAVFFPFKVASLFTLRRTTILLACLYFSCFLASIPWVFGFLEIQWKFVEKFNKTIPTARVTSFYEENKDILDLSNVFVTVIGFGNLSVVALSSVSIAFRLDRVSKKRMKMTSGQSDSKIDLKISRILLAVCVVYVVTGIPSFVIYLYLKENPHVYPTTELYQFLIEIEECSLAVNSAANFVLYTMMSNKFSRAVRDIFRPMFQRKLCSPPA